MYKNNTNFIILYKLNKVDYPPRNENGSFA